MPFDSTGKISFDHIYTAPDPRPFFGTLKRVGYHIPQLAKPYFAKLIGEHPAERPTVLDVGCSYGVNAALRRCDATMDDLYAHYTAPDVRALSHAGLIEADRARVVDPGGAKFYGLDASAPALRACDQAEPSAPAVGENHRVGLALRLDVVPLCDLRGERELERCLSRVGELLRSGIGRRRGECRFSHVGLPRGQASPTKGSRRERKRDSAWSPGRASEQAVHSAKRL